MARTGVTVYDLLLSCPGDVIDLIEIVKECVEGFNRLYGEVNNVKIELKHWSTDSYPQSGGSAQDLLNKQFIHKCDACIALLGNRFGSPTDRYESGTEEEIEDMLEAGKQVFMYFIERAINPSDIDLEQLGKVRKFKEKYSKDSKGIYCIVKNDDEFKTRLLNDLGLHFLNLIVKPQNLIETKYLPKLDLIIEGDVKKENHTDLSNCNLVFEKEKSIKEKIEAIKLINVLNEEVKNIYVEEGEEVEEGEVEISKQIKHNFNFSNLTKIMNINQREAEISEFMKQGIIEYCDKKQIFLSDEFWCLGNLKIKEMSTITLSGYSSSLDGTEEEKKKYKLIKELYVDIRGYNNYIKLFSTIDSYSYLSCYIKNSGTTFDEDIDVKIKIPKECLIKNDEIPVPDIECIEYLNESNFIEIIFSAAQKEKIEKYAYYRIINYTPPQLPHQFLFEQSESKKYEYEKEKYMNDIQRVFCYQYYEDEHNDIIKFNLKYLKQNNSMYLPSILFFKKQPEYIEYEITSKYYPEIIIGKHKIRC